MSVLTTRSRKLSEFNASTIPVRTTVASARSEPFLGSSTPSADFFSRTFHQRLAEHHRRAHRRFYFGGVLSMAARSAGKHDWTFPGRFYRRGGSAILLLKKIRIAFAPTSSFFLFPSYFRASPYTNGGSSARLRVRRQHRAIDDDMILSDSSIQRFDDSRGERPFPCYLLSLDRHAQKRCRNGCLLLSFVLAIEQFFQLFL
jgi:hypothetical protein